MRRRSSHRYLNARRRNGKSLATDVTSSTRTIVPMPNPDGGDVLDRTLRILPSTYGFMLAAHRYGQPRCQRDAAVGHGDTTARRFARCRAPLLPTSVGFVPKGSGHRRKPRSGARWRRSRIRRLKPGEPTRPCPRSPSWSTVSVLARPTLLRLPHGQYAGHVVDRAKYATPDYKSTPRAERSVDASCGETNDLSAGSQPSPSHPALLHLSPVVESPGPAHRVADHDVPPRVVTVRHRRILPAPPM